ncbi:MAG TPA: tetratricopeptide repeat protein [Rhizomicrobium sp.]|nr:tetratricopeptide repeat protein [Rhizomicrobium sp.]
MTISLGVLSLVVSAQYPRAIATESTKDVKAAVAALKAGDSDQALALPTKAIKSTNLSGRDLATAYYDHGSIYLSHNQVDGAIADFDLAITNDPKYAEAHTMRGNALVQRHDVDATIKGYSAALGIDPGNPAAALDLANAYHANKEDERALPVCDSAIRNGPRAFAYEGRSLAHLARGEADLAIADLDEAIRLKPDYIAALLNRANAYETKRQYDEAIADCTAALRISPENTTALNDRANIYARMGKADLAAADYAAAGKAGAAEYRSVGDSYMAQKNYANAVRQYDLALAQAPGDAAVLLNRGACRQQLYQFSQAIADYTAAIKAAPNDARAYNNRGRYLAQRASSTSQLWISAKRSIFSPISPMRNRILRVP